MMEMWEREVAAAIDRDDERWVWTDTPTGVWPFVCANPPAPEADADGGEP